MSNLYASCLSEKQQAAADWVLVCEGGAELPCHSLMLAALSPVLAGLAETSCKPREDGKCALPFPGPRESALCFLRWVYQRQFKSNGRGVTVDIYMNLAKLSHAWDIKGLAAACDNGLATSSHSVSLLKKDMAVKTQIEGAALAEQCGLSKFGRICQVGIAQHFSDPKIMTDKDMEILSSAALRRVLELGYETHTVKATSLPQYICPNCNYTGRASHRSNPNYNMTSGMSSHHSSTSGMTVLQRNGNILVLSCPYCAHTISLPEPQL